MQPENEVSVTPVPIDALSVLCAQLTCNLLAIVLVIRNTVKQERSLTYLVSPDEIQRQERVSVCRSNAEGKKTFLAKR